MNALNPHAMITPESLPVDPLNYLLPLSIMPDEEAAIPLSKDVVTPADGVVPPAKSGLPLASSHSPQAPTQSPNPGSTAHPPPPTVVPGTLQRCGHTKEVKSDPNITLSVLLLMKTSQDTMAKWTVEEKSWNETSCQEEQAWARQLEEKRQQDKDLKDNRREALEWRKEEMCRYKAAQLILAKGRKDREADWKAQETSRQLFESTMLTLLGKLASK
ncbi:hypothetical protein PCANC_25783 [Puccinia coronata f. sp. avenae]|uniref:Uncharacterized protein n=1 Tax=Puccinia coronata f. sp. avenae TaxID=200324 RepID=A0A2N5U4G5_9BASI|nr:hypothetical protein PCANC_25783 [Puccinia coronata f. sp. avenae]